MQNRKLIDADAFEEVLRDKHDEFRKSEDPVVSNNMAGTVFGIIKLLRQQPEVVIPKEGEKERHEKARRVKENTASVHNGKVHGKRHGRI